MIKMVVFDMAGTTINENNVVYKTLRRAINEIGYDFSLNEVLAEGAGKEKLQAIKDILRLRTVERNDEFAEDVYRNFMVLLASAYQTLEITAQPGAEVLFEKLRQKGILVVLNTGYDFKTAQTIMKKVGWEEGNPVDAMVTATQVQHNRPMPDMIHYAMNRFGLTVAQVVAKVGDSRVDIEEGKNAGCGLTIGITTGAQTREQIQETNPDYIIDNLLELFPLLDGR